MGKLSRQTLIWAIAPVFAAGAMALLAAGVGFAASPPSECIDCHGQQDFLVTQKKLYEYFQRWEGSIHAKADVGCHDCHGGNSRGRSKEAAHKGITRVDGEGAGTGFLEVPKMCGKCHEDKYEHYIRSHHYEQLRKQGDEQKGPNCITCHGSLDATALDVTTVRDTCKKCHNEESGNAPEVSARAERLLNDLNSIRGYYHFIDVRADPETRERMENTLDPLLESLGNEWHTFDLDSVQLETRGLLGITKEKVEEVRSKDRGEKKE